MGAPTDPCSRGCSLLLSAVPFSRTPSDSDALIKPTLASSLHLQSRKLWFRDPVTNPETDGFGIRNHGVRGGGDKRLHKNVNYPLANKHQS